MKRMLLFLCLILSSCSWLQEDEPLTVDDPIVIAAAQERLQKYVNIKIENCREEMLEQAEIKVDSMITELIEKYMNDTIYFPPKPIKPDFPKKLNPDTSLTPKPILDFVPAQLNPVPNPDSQKSMTDTLQDNF